MAFNPRMSIIPASQTQSRNARKKEEEADAFMRLSDKEIAGCLEDIGLSFTVADLQKPNPLQVQVIFEWFADLLLNATRDSIEPAMRAAAEDVCGDFIDIVPPDTRNLMGFYSSLRRLLMETGVNDFNFADLYRPTHPRLVKLFSYLINFVRFRESQTNTIDIHFNKSQQTKARITTLYAENEDAENRLLEMQHNHKILEAELSKKKERNDQRRLELIELLRSQGVLAQRLEDAKAKKQELVQALEQKTTEKMMLKQECAKLRPYTLQSPQALQTSLTELTNTLSTDKAHIDSLDRRARALQTSTDSFNVVSTDVASCIKLLDEILGELAKEEEESAKNTKQRDALTERGNNVREAERMEALLQRQLSTWNTRTERLREQSREKAQEAKEKMEELRALHKRLTEERTAKGTEIEKRRVRIEQTEKKMLDLKENIETEVRNAYDEYLKMESHIKLYITEMEQAI